MSDTSSRRPRLPPQAEALPRYLDALLRETWEAPMAAFEPVDLAPPAEPMTPSPETASPMPGVEAAASAATWTMDVHSPLGAQTSSAAAPFEAQLFHLAGLTLALPVSALAGIVDSTDLVTAGEADAPWLRGRLCYQHGEIQVVDTAHWVLSPGMSWSPATRPYPVLIIADGRWGLACDGIGAVVTLDPAAVRWRSARTQRRWLAGMVSQPSSCALLDSAQFAALFAEALGTGAQPGSP